MFPCLHHCMFSNNSVSKQILFKLNGTVMSTEVSHFMFSTLCCLSMCMKILILCMGC